MLKSCVHYLTISQILIHIPLPHIRLIDVHLTDKHFFYQKECEERAQTVAKQSILGQNKEKQNYDKNTILLPRQCLRDGAKALILLGFLDGRIEFTPLEDRIGSQDVKKTE